MHGSVQYTISDLANSFLSLGPRFTGRSSVLHNLMFLYWLESHWPVRMRARRVHRQLCTHSDCHPLAFRGNDPLGQVVPKCAEGEYAQAPGATPHSLVRLDRCVRSLP